jgi:hypothetical protein
MKTTLRRLQQLEQRRSELVAADDSFGARERILEKMARPGNLWVELGSSLALSEEAVEFAASGVEGALLIF